MIHHLDPLNLHRVAKSIGEAVARGETDMEIATDICRLAADAAPKHQAYKGDVSGLYVRLCWAARDACADLTRRRSNAAMAVRWAVRSLIERRETPDLIEAAAKLAAGDVLLWEHINAILRDEVARGRNRRRK